jgi:hypothetical protein
VTSYDRDEVLARVDLAELATEVCGPAEGRGAGAKWHCPNPDHSDAHPSMTVYVGQRSARWKCHSCGDGGTAIDLWMTTQRCGVRDAIEALAARGQVAPRPGEDRRSDLGPSRGRTGPGAPEGRPSTPDGPDPPPSKLIQFRAAEPAPAATDPRIESYVAVAAQILWGTLGAPGRDWLRARGFSDEVLRVNRVGFDPGPRAFHRDRGLPWRGAGIVYPALAADGTALYFQTRYLDPAAAGRDKYDNPTSALAVNPRIAALCVPDADPALDGLVVVTEGIPDGLAVAHAGARPAAIIGAANHGPAVAHRLHRMFPTGTFLVVFDADDAGRRGGALLGAHLAALGRDVVLSAPPRGHNDINDWWKSEPDRLADTLTAGSRAGLYQPATMVATTPDPPDVTAGAGARSRTVGPIVVQPAGTGVAGS